MRQSLCSSVEYRYWFMMVWHDNSPDSFLVELLLEQSKSKEGETMEIKKQIKVGLTAPTSQGPKPLGVLRVFTSHYGGSWFPLFTASKLKKKEENYWMGGLNSSKLFCILCKSPVNMTYYLWTMVEVNLSMSFSVL
ncbi:hypothetical protein L6452_00936 [Arctium lappa]|uniref:Uncharacterized protein n=1 Tax=Arctium lappa TaxID=4217 RepID=A0ACB9FER5_ARCLA|nr:hypothetical protein L6452_00936 [Arctium lappa]